MLKRIDSDQLRLGMHIHEFCGSWMNHPFWRTSFALDDARDLQKIKASGVGQVWIDTAKGLDTAAMRMPRERPSEPAKRPLPSPQRVAVAPVPMAQEIARASHIITKSHQTLRTMFNEVRMGRAFDVRQAAHLVEEITQSVLRNPHTLISLARLKSGDNYTYMHSVAVCALMVVLSLQLGLDATQTREAGMGGLLHDIGKMAVPLHVLNKPGNLTDVECGAIQRHPQEGYQWLREDCGVGDIVRDICLHHHERVDGTGYPERLAGGKLSVYARMAAVCDVYDALTSNRPYKKGWPPTHSLQRMAAWCKSHFDETIFHAFVKSIGIYPVGTLVRLDSDVLGVIMEHNQAALLLPKVKVFYSSKSQKRLPPTLLDLSSDHVTAQIIGHENPEKWGIADLRELWTTCIEVCEHS